MLWGDLIRTHVLWMQVKELGGGALAMITAPVIFSLDECKGTPLNDTYEYNKRFWEA